MLAVLLVIFPVFGLIALGFVAARTGYLDEPVGRAVSEFAFKAGLPAVLFKSILATPGFEGRPVALWVSFFGVGAVVWIAASIFARRIGRSHSEGASIAMGSVFGNGFMLAGTVAITAFGEAAVAPVALLVLLDTPVLWLAGMLHMQIAQNLQPARSPGTVTTARPSLSTIPLIVAREMATNPLVIAMVCGLAWRATGLGLAPAPDRLLTFFAGCGIPCALFALGMRLAVMPVRGEWHAVTLMTSLKLIAFPLGVAILAFGVFDLPPVWAATVVIFAAAPVGANAFLFASRYDVGVPAVSASVSVSTILAAVTMSVILLWLGVSG